MAKDARIEIFKEDNTDRYYRICSEIESKFCCRYWVNKKYADLVKAVKWPSELEKSMLQNANSNHNNAVKPIMVHGIIIHTEESDQNEFRIWLCDTESKRNFDDAETLLHLNKMREILHSVVGISSEINGEFIKTYSIGDLHKLKPGKHVVMAISDLRVVQERIMAELIDIVEFDKYNYYPYFLDNNYKICGDTQYIQLFQEKINEFYESDQNNRENNTEGCYIATAVYGSYDCPEVWTLRRFRDNVLSKTWYGRTFVRLYYFISPTLVKCFGNANWFKRIWKAKLDDMVNKLKESGFESHPYHDMKQ